MPRTLRSPLPQPVFHEPIFGEDGSLSDPTGFSTTHPSDNALYKKIGDLSKKDVVAVPKSRIGPDEMFSLAEAYGSHGPQIVKKITTAGKIIFHVLGDSGIQHRQIRRRTPCRRSIVARLRIDRTQDNRAAFLFHLGDVVYNFGEAQYYYDQFYEPFRPTRRRSSPFPAITIRSSCRARRPDQSRSIPSSGISAPSSRSSRPRRASLHRTAMTQPGVYYCLDAPFVRIIGLFSNALEDPGVISNRQQKMGQRFQRVKPSFCAAQLKRIKSEKFAGAVLLATHHPPFSYAPPKREAGGAGGHGCSTVMLREIDAICHEEGVYPHAFLSAHAHNYQRYTRIMKFGASEIDVPFYRVG